MVTSQPSSAAATAVRSAASKRGRSDTSWSAAKLPTMAVGSWRAMRAVASAIAGPEPRGDGSTSTLRSGRAGSWRATGAAWAGPQTTSVRSGGTLGARRSIVCCNNERSPSSGSRNLGRAARLSGHRRVPDPPAGTTAHRFTGTRGRLWSARRTRFPAHALPCRCESRHGTMDGVQSPDDCSMIERSTRWSTRSSTAGLGVDR